MSLSSKEEASGDRNAPQQDLQSQRAAELQQKWINQSVSQFQRRDDCQPQTPKGRA